MQRMTGIDPMFVYSETPAAPMEVAYTCVFDPTTSPTGEYDFAAVRNRLAQRLPRLAPFRRRLVDVPLGLDAPRWVDDPAFDIDNHLHRTALPSPGGDAELGTLAAQIMGRPLHPAQPPWEMRVIENLAGGMVGLVAKVHHAAVDGVSGAQLMAQLLDLTPDCPDGATADSPWQPPRLPSGPRLVAEAIPSLLTSPVRAIRAAREIGRSTASLAWHAARGGNAVSVPLGAPARFSVPIGPSRAVALAQVSLRDVLALRDLLGVTVNDIAMALCSGALHSYLADHDQDRADSLVALVPVSVRQEDERDGLGNRLSAMFVPLASDRQSPLDRLQGVATACRAAKTQERAVGYGALASAVSDAVPPVLARPALRLGARLGAVRKLRPANLVVSNVPGPDVPLFFAGMQLRAVYPIGPVVDGVSLNITVQSYLDSLFVGINACPQAVPDVGSLADAVVGELGRLTEEATCCVRPISNGKAARHT